MPPTGGVAILWRELRETHRVGNNNNASVNAVGERGGCFTRFPTMVHPVAAQFPVHPTSSQFTPIGVLWE